jgi:hypothetical protein
MLHAADTPALAFMFLTFYGVVMSVLLLRLLTAQFISCYARLLNETQGFAVLSAASFILQLEAVMPFPSREEIFKEHQFEIRLAFDRMDMGPPGGVQVFDPLAKWPIVETDRVQRYTGAAGRDEPWPVAAAEVTLEERLTGLDSRIRGMMHRVEQAAHQNNHSAGSMVMKSQAKSSDKSASQRGGLKKKKTAE